MKQSYRSLVLLSAVFLAACDNNASVEPSASTAAQISQATTTSIPSSTAQAVKKETPETTTDADTAGISPLGDANLAAKDHPSTTWESLISNIRVAHHDGFDRVVFDIAGENQPGWHIDYDATPVQQTSGFNIDYQGNTALVLYIEGLTYPFAFESDDISDVDGQTFAGAGNVTEVQAIGTFEGQGQFIIGLKKQLPYSIQLLQNPPRLVVDIVE